MHTNKQMDEYNNMRGKVDIIAKGLVNDLPESVIEKQISLFEFLNNDKAFYTIKDDMLYKVIPCK